ncbi:hypothetical protein GQ53DRAFT_401154 [Thozetella sp. PMI_491]|nr:hypothetical protein GQ53DRAFT_401154 [Thozetella sp. PMI_491]
MDGSYGNAFPPRSSQMSPSNPASSSNMYKTNVNRSKTRKWVEAKVQSYDGDDWGADYDEPEEHPPLPPAKPMGPRQVSGPPSSVRPTQPVDLAASSAGLRSPSGPPALQIQTQSQQQQPPAPAAPKALPAPSQADTDSPWRARRSATDQMASTPQSAPATQSAATASSVYSGGLAQSQASSTPQSAGAAPLRFPPRKSSMSSQQDPVDYSELARQPASTTSDSSQKPWNEPQSASPANAKSPNKPLPFIRPADIYRRMEEEREKERRSMESARPSLDGSDVRGSILGSGPASPQTHTPQRAVQEAAQDAQNPSPEARAEGAPSSKPTLAPVAERKSEYGLEGLLASYGTEEGLAEPIPTEPSAPLNTTQSLPSQNVPGQSDPAQTSGAEKDLRRFSTSPKLPDFARMSAFGDDLFSDSPRSFMSGPQPLSTVSDEPEAAIPAPSGPPRAVSPVLEKEETPSLADPATSSSIVVAQPPNVSVPLPAIDTLPAKPPPQALGRSPRLDQVEHAASEDSTSPLAQSHGLTDLASRTQQEEGDLTLPAGSDIQVAPAEGVAHQQTEEERSRILQSSPTGGWVPETPIMPGHRGTAVPASLQTDTLPAVSYARDVGEISPISEAGENAEDTTVAGMPEPGVSSAKAVVEATDADVEMPSASPSVATDPPAGPFARLQTPSPAPAASSEAQSVDDSMAKQEGEIFETANTGSESPRDEPTTPVPNTATTAQPDITPTAPLNPRKDAREVDVSNEGFVVPPSLERVSTIDTNTSSPVKESDVLREEIIRSLSPMSAGTPLPQSTDFMGSGVHTGAAETPRENPVRESSYLGDVYGDYWSANDEKQEQDAAEPTGQNEATGIPEPATTPKPLETVRLESASPDNSPPAPEPTSPNAISPRLRERFSWEVLSEESIEPKSLGMGPEAPAIGTPTADLATGHGHEETADPSASRSVPSITPGAPNTAKSSQAAAPSISHQISLVSTIPPRSELEVPIEPPSPVSVLSERNTTAPESHRLSLRDEKALAQSSSTGVAPSPPHDQHPALQEGPPTATVMTGAAGTPQPINIIPFRQILDTASPADRIRLYKETRQQFALLDTGLGHWLSETRALRPEHLNATSSFSANLSLGPPPVDPTAGGLPGSPQGAQPPYHQQYLNASTTRVGSPGGRPASNMPMPPPPLQGASSFGHTSNQVGAKSKEFLMVAGKVGKGLLSKGKNKLRNTGDKVFSS